MLVLFPLLVDCVFVYVCVVLHVCVRAEGCVCDGFVVIEVELVALVFSALTCVCVCVCSVVY